MLVTLALTSGCGACPSINGTYELSHFENVDFCDYALNCFAIDPTVFCTTSISGISLLLRFICQESPTLNYLELRVAYFRTSNGGCAWPLPVKVDIFRNDFGGTFPDCFGFEDVQLDYVEPIVPTWCTGSAYVTSP